MSDVLGEPTEVVFLTVEIVLSLHQRQFARYGGSTGLRDRRLLESAVAQAQISFGGVYVHEGIFAQAAAYLFHIVSNHPFVDGNKRTGLLAAQVFLHLNGIVLLGQTDAFYRLTMAVADGSFDKAAVMRELRRIATVHNATE